MTTRFSEIAEKSKEIEKELGLNLDAVLHKLTQEFGEFNDAVQKFRGIYSRSIGSMEHVEEEAGDLMFNLISVLYELGISPDELENYAEKTLKKFEERKNLYKKKIKITICGSAMFISEMEKLKNELESLEHEVKIPIDEFLDENGNKISSYDFRRLREEANYLNNPTPWLVDRKKYAINEHFKKIDWSEIILVANYDKDGIKNYIGGNTLIEIGLASYLNKRIFFLNPIPEVSYKDELIGIQPVIINGNLELLK
jgi:NTP pyrophosphatase (non-canonical NTP hydrolase)